MLQISLERIGLLARRPFTSAPARRPRAAGRTWHDGRHDDECSKSLPEPGFGPCRRAASGSHGASCQASGVAVDQRRRLRRGNPESRSPMAGTSSFELSSRFRLGTPWWRRKFGERARRLGEVERPLARPVPPAAISTAWGGSVADEERRFTGSRAALPRTGTEYTVRGPEVGEVDSRGYGEGRAVQPRFSNTPSLRCSGDLSQ